MSRCNVQVTVPASARAGAGQQQPLNGPAPLAQGGVVTGPLATPNSDNIYDGVGGGTDAYTFYTGNGQDGWPDQSQWVSFVDM